MRKLLLIVPALLLATGCSMLFKPRDNGGMGNTTFGNLSDGNMLAPLPPVGNSGGDLTADQGGTAGGTQGGGTQSGGDAAGGKPNAPADDGGAAQEQPPQPDQGGSGDDGGTPAAPGPQDEGTGK